MSEFKTENAKFNDKLEKINTNDRVTADVPNSRFEQLINNDVSLKKDIEGLESNKLDKNGLDGIAKETTPKNIESKVIDTNTKINNVESTISNNLKDVAKETTPNNIENKVIDIDNKVSNIGSTVSDSLKDVAKETTPNNIENKVAQNNSWLSGMNNQINDTSTSYMNGKVSIIYGGSIKTTNKIISMYSWISDIYNEIKINNQSHLRGRLEQIYNEITGTSTNYLKGKLEQIYSEITGTSTNSLKEQIAALYNNMNNPKVVKSVQRGVLSMSRNNEVYLINISTVSPSKCTISLFGTSYVDSSSRPLITNNTPYVGDLNSSTIVLRLDSYITYPVKMSWEIVEFY